VDALLIGCTVAAVALMPVSVPLRWTMLLLAGLSWPFLYSLKLGQVAAILLLLFASAGGGWIGPGRIGRHTGIGTLSRSQPALLGVWACWPAGAPRRGRRIVVSRP